ncbi:MAG: polysaccharide biosynthesis C-terminal domain-containing protein [Cyanobacteriota bacterium]|nr:polysaccharide biosynthesis C-terminal domain-containing protein [Cyanobacteriota bacterium]
MKGSRWWFWAGETKAEPAGDPYGWFRRAFWLMGGSGIRLILSGAYFILLARLLEPSQFGLFSGIAAGCNLIAPFAFLGQSDGLIQRLSRHPEQHPWAWGNALLIASVGGVGLLGALSLPLSLWLQVDPVTVLALGWAEMVVVGWQEVQKGVLVAREQIKEVALIDVGMALGRLLSVLLGEGSLSSWAIHYALILAGVAGLTQVAMLGWVGWPRWALGKLPGMVREGWDFAVGLAAMKTFTDLDKLLLPVLANAAATGFYSAGYRVINFAQTPVLALLTSSFAEVCRQGSQGIHAGWGYGRRLLPWIVGYGGIASLAILLLSWGIPWVLGAAYSQTAQVLRWLSGIVLLEGMQGLFANLLTGIGQQRLRSRWQLVALTLNGLLNLGWIPLWGWQGAAAATLFSEILLVGGLGCLIFREYQRAEVQAGQESRRDP